MIVLAFLDKPETTRPPSALGGQNLPHNVVMLESGQGPDLAQQGICLGAWNPDAFNGVLPILYDIAGLQGKSIVRVTVALKACGDDPAQVRPATWQECIEGSGTGRRQRPHG